MWQREGKVRTASENAGGMDIFMMGFDDLLCDRESKTGSGLILSAGDVCFVKSIPDMWEAVLRDADAVVTDGDEDLIFLYSGLNLNR